MENKNQTVRFESISESSVSEEELYKFCKQLSQLGIQTHFCQFKRKDKYCLEAIIPISIYQQFWLDYAKDMGQRVKVRNGKIKISPYSLIIRDRLGKPIVINNLGSKFEAMKYLADRVAAGIKMWKLGDRKNVEQCTFNFVGEKQVYPIIENKMRNIWNGLYIHPRDLPCILENSLKIAQGLEDICIVSTGVACIVCDARPDHEENNDFKALATLSESTGELLSSFSGMSSYAKEVVETVQKDMINRLQNVNKLKEENKIQFLSLHKKNLSICNVP